MAAPDDELGTLLEQLDEVLGEPILDGDDAFEVLVLAALAARLGASGGALEQVIEWRDGDGRELVDDAFLELDVEALAEAVEACLNGDADRDAVEEALLDVDEAVAAAIWCGKTVAVRSLAARVEDAVRQVPEVFAALSDDGREMARHPDVARWPDLYGFWLAVADAGVWADA